MELRDDSLVDMKFMVSDSGFTDRYFYKQIQKGNLPSPKKYGRSSRWEYKDYKCWKQSCGQPMKSAA
ncbi:helix-turn-helix transcriptional regulator [Pantoea agglomerans]|uniref:helix-turn-helix transcriptional regulator n=1 Tax=Enterobacter agglomerans TaxID=549 RepID=UPI003DA088FA